MDIERTRKRTGKIVVLLTSAFLLITFLVSSSVFGADLKTAPEHTAFMHHPAGSAETYVEIQAIVGKVDTQKRTVKLHYQFKPHGAIAAPGVSKVPFVNRNVTVNLDEKVMQVQANKALSTKDASTSFESGAFNMYPFDEYKAELAFNAHETENAMNLIPIKLNVLSRAHGWRIKADFYDDPAHQSITLGLTITRKAATKFFSVFVFVMMWLLSLTLLIVTLMPWLQNKEIPIGLVGGTITAMFALPKLRETQPGVPTVGAILDMYGFFWNMLFLMIAVILASWNYLYMSRKKKH